MAEQKIDPSIQSQIYFDKSVGIITSLQDSALTANATYSDDAKSYGPIHCRIGQSKIAWIAKAAGDHIEIDLCKSCLVTGIATKAREGSDQWVTQYRVETSEDGTQWTDRGLFRGNHDRNTICTRKLKQSTVASFVRITILKYHGHPSLRLDILVYNFK
eukprot:400166_1